MRELVEARREEIKAIVARHHGQSVAIFGSVARGEERPDSDLDFLVELAPDARPIEILSIGVELEAALGVKVDVGTPASLRERLRDEVLATTVADVRSFAGLLDEVARAGSVAVLGSAQAIAAANDSLDPQLVVTPVL